MKGKNTTFITRQKRWPKNRSKVWADTREIIIAGTHPLLRDKGGYHHARRSRGGAGGSYYRGGNASYGARYNSDYEQPPQEGDLRQTGAYYRNGYTDTRPYYSANSRHYQAQPSPGTTMVQIRTTYRNVAIVKIRTAGPRAPRKKIMTKKSQVQIPEHAGRSSTPTTDERWQHQQQKW